MFEDDLRCAFDEDHLLAARILVQRGHELMFRLEGDRVNSGIGILLGLALEAELVPVRIKRPFGGVALHLPNAFLLKYFGIVAEH